MRIFLVSLLIAAFVSCSNSQTEKAPEKVASRHSAGFNASVQSAMDSYYQLTEAFVNWDSAAVDRQAADLKVKLDSIDVTAIAGSVADAANTLDLAKRDLQSMTSSKDITGKRHELNALTQHLYSFLQAVQYDEKIIYRQECPMAFDDTVAADWLSGADTVRNPYLGLHHPKYGKAMLECGGNKSTIDFRGKK